jgi:hypothetical protein
LRISSKKQIEHQSDEIEIRSGSGSGRTILKESRTSGVVAGSYL